MQLYQEKRRIIITLIVLFILIGIFYFIESRFSLSELKSYINSFGQWSSFVLLIAIIITSSTGLVSPIPVVLASLLLSSFMAFLISMSGLAIGATISFFLARYIGRDYIERKFIKRIKSLKQYDEKLEKRGFWMILFLRLIYLVPFELINITAGLSRVHFIKFISATIVGIIPTVIITIFVVKNTQNYLSPLFIFAVSIMTLFAILPLLSKRIRKIVFNLD
jgi:uncharacterized membrane protein YdjX (TVP38/TMEM64 family)